MNRGNFLPRNGGNQPRRPLPPTSLDRNGGCGNSTSSGRNGGDDDGIEVYRGSNDLRHKLKRRNNAGGGTAPSEGNPPNQASSGGHSSNTSGQQVNHKTLIHPKFCATVIAKNLN